MLLHILVVVVQTANWEVPWSGLVLCPRHHDTLASTSAWSAHRDFFAFRQFKIHPTRAIVLDTGSSIVKINTVANRCSNRILAIGDAVRAQHPLKVQIRHSIIFGTLPHAVLPLVDLLTTLHHLRHVATDTLPIHVLRWSMIYICLEVLQTLNLILDVRIVHIHLYPLHLILNQHLLVDLTL